MTTHHEVGGNKRINNARNNAESFFFRMELLLVGFRWRDDGLLHPGEYLRTRHYTLEYISCLHEHSKVR